MCKTFWEVDVGASRNLFVESVAETLKKHRWTYSVAILVSDVESILSLKLPI